MRGDDLQQAGMFSYLSPEQRVPQAHPLRAIRKISDAVFVQLSPQFTKLYARMGRPSIAPEKLLRALLLQVLYSVRSERLLMEELDYNMLFRWFVGLNLDNRVWDPTTFTKNRDRLLRGDIAAEFFAAVLDQARGYELLSDEHFTVDGTLLEAAASLKSFKLKEQQDEPPTDNPSNPDVNFRGEKRSNDTHQSTTDPEAMLCRKGKGKEAKLGYAGHLLMENRNGLAVSACVTPATGTAEREAGLAFAEEISGDGRVTLGGDKNYDTRDFVRDLRTLAVTPHVAQNDTNRKSAIDGRTTRHEGYQVSQRKRKRIEEIFGWLKTVGLLRKLRHRGTERVNWIFIFATAAYNLVRMRKLLTV
ncbi:MAG: IS5 family transposase [Acidobacteriota bacterium]|nr:IS5 family transposase [Acidobacteriota bacterium]